MKIIIKEITINLYADSIKDKLNSLNALIATCREKLMMLAASNPRQVEDEDDNKIDWVDHVQFEINSIMNDLDEYLYERHLLEIADEYPGMVEELRD